MVKRLLLILSFLILLSSCTKANYITPYVGAATIGSDIPEHSSKEFFSLESAKYIDFDFSYAKFAFFADSNYILKGESLGSETSGISYSKKEASITYKASSRSREYHIGFVAYAKHLAYKDYGCQEFIYPNFLIKSDQQDNPSFLSTDRTSKIEINVRGWCLIFKPNLSK